MIVILYIILYLIGLINAVYLPGVAPKGYYKEEKVPLTVNSLSPMAGPMPGSVLQYYRNVYMYDYYDERFHFCNKKGAKALKESLGSIIFGDRIFTSDFEIFMAKNETCKVLCSTTIPLSDIGFVIERVRENYGINWFIDGLPAVGEDPLYADGKIYSLGFPLGNIEELKNTVEINNHYHIIIEYHKFKNEVYRVVGVTVIPLSKMSTIGFDENADCSSKEPYILDETKNNSIIYTYDIFWRESDVTWATRWDKYLHVYSPRIHWLNLFSSSVIVFFLIGMVMTVLTRTLHKDIMRYNSDFFDQEDFQEDSGWKLVYGDVFRIPKHSMLLSIILGNGVQLFLMTIVTIFFAMFGFLSPSNRGSLGTFMIVLYFFFAFFSGYVSSRMYKSLGGEFWLKNAIFAPIFIPGIVFFIFFLLNLVLISAHSSGVVPLKTMFVIVTLWFLVSMPLSIAGSFFGFRTKSFSHPVKTNQIPRQIPSQASYMKFLPSFFIGGILPFGAIFVELYFVLNSIWFSNIYYIFGFLFICYIIMVLTCSTVTILMIYMQLCSEDYHWWWRSFFIGGSPSFYVFINFLLFWFSRIRLSSFASHILYLGYSFLLTFLFFILTGTIGFFSSYFFVRKIYNSIKID
ncbi:hypothetical protein PNEG_02325 [Pneumocystis murina B123]|uniref:Transmembrane 9 superfamily member n=1 Tax=Pneumocystis murina (strain B123) TaxID=1069680 RepID=M7NQ40_PNEMU|nr:hypothetical protein PNEG_02325 [Pneumocystis murina B123]EMR09377.1 hypothetical protein PNEG_02325 [Pneumocystis murina B123]